MALNGTGWVIMLVSLACVWGLVGWCYRKILTAPPDDEVIPPPQGFGA